MQETIFCIRISFISVAIAFAIILYLQNSRCFKAIGIFPLNAKVRPSPCSPPPDAFSFRLPLSIAGRTDRWNHTQFTNSTTLPHYVWTPFSWHSSYCTGHPLQLGSWHFLVARSVKSLPGIKLQQVRCPVPLPLPLLSNPLYWGTGTSNSDHVATGRP